MLARISRIPQAPRGALYRVVTNHRLLFCFVRSRIRRAPCLRIRSYFSPVTRSPSFILSFAFHNFSLGWPDQLRAYTHTSTLRNDPLGYMPTLAGLPVKYRLRSAPCFRPRDDWAFVEYRNFSHDALTRVAVRVPMAVCGGLGARIIIAIPD
jgi:hypothetical protein